jgi:iron-sulfur cluster repair protein YtfE (RIC family)
MLRDKNLIPLSHQHRRALAITVNIARGRGPGYADPQRWRDVILEHYESDLRFHLEAEETILFPAAARYSETAALVEDLRAEHVRLRELVETMRSGEPAMELVREFGALLDAHIRKEERGLFESMQDVVPAAQMAELGRAMDEYFAGQAQKCGVRS